MKKVVEKEEEITEAPDGASVDGYEEYVSEVHDHLQADNNSITASYDINHDLLLPLFKSGISAFQAVSVANVISWL